MKLGEGHRSCPNGGWVNCKEHDRPPALAGAFGITAATCQNKINNCCCCNGLAGYLLNPPGERPFNRKLCCRMKWRSKK